MFFLDEIIYRSDKISFLHGFSTRLGGVSTHAHTATMNLAFGRGDDDDTVLQNLEIFAKKVGVDAKSVISVSQIHSCDVRIVDASYRGMGYFKEAEFSCDGYVTNKKGVALCVKTADCVPILLADEENGVIGALHAGWRGSVGGIARVGVQKMIELGAKPENIKAAIGAAIGACCYEVGEEVYLAAKENLGEKFASRFIVPDGKKYRADLKGLDRALLESVGLLPENIDVCPECTACNAELFFSHRATGGVRGTMCALISL